MFPGTVAVFSWMASCCFVFLCVTDAAAGHLFKGHAAGIQVLAALLMDKTIFVGSQRIHMNISYGAKCWLLLGLQYV